jgi:hypothetical protein
MNEQTDRHDSADNAMSSEVKSARLEICNAILISTAIMSVPTVVTSLYRITTIGWQPVMAIHILFAVGLWLMVICRKKIAYPIQAGFLVSLFLVIGLSGILQFGLVAPGIAFFVVAGPLAVLLFGKKIGIASLLVGFSGAVLIGWLTTTGDNSGQINIADYVVAPASWNIALFAWAFASIALSVSLFKFNEKLFNVLTISEQRYEQLTVANKKLGQSNVDLQAALKEISSLQGIIPICSYCHSIRDGIGAWSHLETYISNHSAAEFSHGICPDCNLKILKELEVDDH